MVKNNKSSFSYNVKIKLSSIYPQENHCALCELAGMTLFSNCFSIEKTIIVSEIPEVIDKYIGLLIRCIEFDSILNEKQIDENKYSFELTESINEKLYSLFVKENHINNDIFKCEKCKIAFIRGAFLVSGYVNPPGKDYDIEFKTNNVDISCDFYSLLSEFITSTKMTFRNGMQIVYNKHGDNVYYLLNDMGDTVHSFEIVNSQLLKSIRNEENRKTNFEISNIKKQNNSAIIQIEAIKYLKKTKEFKQLSETLQKTAQLRMKYKNYSIAQLASLEQPPISKSQESKRLSTIVSFYEQIKKSKGD